MLPDSRRQSKKKTVGTNSRDLEVLGQPVDKAICETWGQTAKIFKRRRRQHCPHPTKVL